MRLIFPILLAASALTAADTYTVTTEMVPMRDGVRLATDVYRPAAPGRYPVLVTRTPYNRSGERRKCIYYAEHGYVALAQDVRGRFGSPGKFYAFVNEGPDGYDTIGWAAAQPWSNGKVGTFGASYLGWDQYFAAMYRPPHLTAMFVNVGGANFYDEFGWPGGAPNLGWPIWILKSAETSPQAALHPDAREVLARYLQNPGPWLALSPGERARVFADFPDHRRMYEDFYAHPHLDAYWKQRGFYTAGYYPDIKDVPTFFISGWYDYFDDGVIANFQGLRRIGKTEKKLWLGPWPHGIGADHCGDADFGPSAAVDVQQITLDWFDHWLKGAPYRVIGPAAVHYFRMGGGAGGRDAHGRRRAGGEWLNAEQWPPAGTRTAKWYIAGGGLRTAPAASEPGSSYRYDPAHPVPTIGGRFGIGSWTPNCAQDQVCNLKILGCDNTKPLSERPDVLSYATQPLAAPVDAAGPVRVRLWVSSDAPSADFTAKLMDVSPDGYAMVLLDGQVRVQGRPGEVHPITIQLGNMSNRFAARHRIRVDVSSSNYPRIEPNSHAARNTVYHDAARPSYVELPVVAK